jgi:predicted GTPase
MSYYVSPTPLPIDEATLNAKRQRILQAKSALADAGVDYFNWLVVGQAGYGKSTLLNSLCTALAGDGRFRTPFKARSGDSHGTVSYDWLELDKVQIDSDDRALADCRLRFLDLWGAVANANFKSAEVVLIMDGKLPNGFKDGAEALLESEQMLPSWLGTAPHGLMLVVDAPNYDNDEAYHFFDKFVRLAVGTGDAHYDVPVFVVVTKIDEHDERMRDQAHLAYCGGPVLPATRHEVVNKCKGVELRDTFLVRSYLPDDSAPSASTDSALLHLASCLLDRSRNYLHSIRTRQQQAYAGYLARPVVASNGELLRYESTASSSSSAASSSSANDDDIDAATLKALDAVRKASGDAILLLGQTGGGKSALGNALLGGVEAFKESARLRSCTESISVAEGSLFGERGNDVTVIDTPGFLDSEGRGRAFVQLLLRFLKAIAQNRLRLVVVTLPLTEQRANDTYSALLDQIELLIGDQLVEHLVFVTTQGNTLRGDAARRAELADQWTLWLADNDFDEPVVLDYDHDEPESIADALVGKFARTPPFTPKTASNAEAYVHSAYQRPEERVGVVQMLKEMHVLQERFLATQKLDNQVRLDKLHAMASRNAEQERELNARQRTQSALEQQADKLVRDGPRVQYQTVYC